MMDFCVLGSGIAGSTIANLLSKKYTVEINGHPVASFSRILDAVEATDFELQQISQQAAWSARDDADWRNAAVD